MGRRRVRPRDPGSAAVAGLTDLTIVVGRRARLAEVPGAEERVRFSFWRRGGSVEVAGGDAVVEPGDQVVIVGGQEAVAEAVDWLGTRADEHLAHDRREVDYRRVLLSNTRLAGSTVAELDIGGRFGGVVTRVRRGDLDLLARDDLHVLLGDRLRVVVPRGRMPEVTRYLGDTERRVSEVDAVSLGLGLVLGFLLGLVSLPLGSVTLSLGIAAGPLVAGIVLGWLERTGPIVWSLPTGASLTLLTHRLGMSPARSGGLIAGFVGNPSLLAFATGKLADERVNEGYATLFALDTILKVLLVQVIVGLGG
jgi:putative transport protein